MTASLLGLDPGTTTGYALVTPSGDVEAVGSAGPLEAVRLVSGWSASGALAGAYVEDARALPIYARHGRANRGERDRIARGVGAVDLLTGLYVELLESLGVPVATVEPSRQTKWDAETCGRITGYTGRTNEHGRDALRLVYGRGVPRPLLSRRSVPATP